MPTKLTDEQLTKKILDISSHISSVMNNYYLKEFGRLHNISDEYNTFELKQEMIAKRGLFPGAKKKYAFHITNMEGVNVDELDIKGLVTQRSDYSALTKERILTLIKMLCKEETIVWSEIKTFIQNTRNEFIKLCRERRKEIGRPVSFSKSLEDYKKIPSHVIGMDLWNQTMYHHFEQGVKGYAFRIKGLDANICPAGSVDLFHRLGKPNFVVMPFEEERLPDFFILDEEEILNFCWNDRIKELLDCVWEKVEPRTAIKKAALKFD